MPFGCKSYASSSPLIAATVLIGMFSAAAAASAQASYRVLDHWKIGGEGGWDYLTVDSAAHRLYVTHGPRVDVLDATNGKAIGSITGLKGTHGVALDDSGRVGYISDGGGNAVVVFDRSSLQTLATIPAGKNPDAIVFDPLSKTVWAFNGRSNDVSVIDARARKVIATVSLPGKPEFAVADGKGAIFLNIEDKNEIVRLDVTAKSLSAEWPLTNCGSPSGLAFDSAGRRLFSVCDGKKMAVTNADTGQSLATPPIGDGPDAAGYDVKHKLAFSSNGDGTLTIVDANRGSCKVVQTLSTEKGARTMALDQSTGRVYLVTAEFGPRPAATKQNPRPRPAIVPGSFTVLVVGQ